MLTILYEDNHLIAINKEAGLLTQDDSTGDPSAMSLLKKYLKEKYKKPGKVFLGMVQRLYKPVSGVLIFAKTSKAASRINEAFRSRSVIKLYAAVVEHADTIPCNTWTYIEQGIEKRGYSQIVSSTGKNTKKATLTLLKITEYEGLSLLLIDLLTGKKHQIRAQLASKGMPIVGDTRYGSPVLLSKNTICLHSMALSIPHPITKQSISFLSNLPDRFHTIMKIDKESLVEINRIIQQKMKGGPISGGTEGEVT